MGNLWDYKYEDSNGRYRLIELRNTHKEFGKKNRPNLWYPFYVDMNTNSISLEKTDDDQIEVFPLWPDGYEGCWTWGKSLAETELSSLVAKKNKNGWKIYRKSYSETKNGEVVKQKPFSIWNDPTFYTEKGQEEFKKIFPGTSKDDFPQPKSLDYISTIIRTITKDNDIILDSFAGSGTTAHAVLNVNSKYGGNRHFIGIEVLDYADTITSERIKRVITGYDSNEGISDSFCYYELSEPLLDENGNINESIDMETLRQYIFFTDTRQTYEGPYPDRPFYMGTSYGKDYYFFYLKDQPTTLDETFMDHVPESDEGYVIYADMCALSKQYMDAKKVTFKKIPRDIVRL